MISCTPSSRRVGLVAPGRWQGRVTVPLSVELRVVLVLVGSTGLNPRGVKLSPGGWDLARILGGVVVQVLAEVDRRVAGAFEPERRVCWSSRACVAPVGGLFRSTPWLWAYWPVMKVARDGQQSGKLTKLLSNVDCPARPAGVGLLQHPHRLERLVVGHDHVDDVRTRSRGRADVVAGLADRQRYENRPGCEPSAPRKCRITRLILKRWGPASGRFGGIRSSSGCDGRSEGRTQGARVPCGYGRD